MVVAACSKEMFDGTLTSLSTGTVLYSAKLPKTELYLDKYKLITNHDFHNVSALQFDVIFLSKVLTSCWLLA